MANIIVYVDSLLRPYYKYMMVFFLFVVFVTVARFSYQMYVSKTMEKKKRG